MTNPTPPRDDALSSAISDLISRTREGDPWTAFDFWDHDNQPNVFDGHVAEILNAVFDGRLCRRADQPARVGVDRERVAVALWQNELGDSAPRVRKARTLDHFREQLDEIQAKFLRNADAAIAALLPTEAGAEPHPDELAVDRFAAAMKAKLAKKRAEGRGGWEGPECSESALSDLLRNHVEKGDPLDVGNLAMMLHQRGERIATPPAAPTDNTALVEALKPFGDAVYNDNGDVTIDQSHLTRGHWLSARAALSRPAPQAVTVQDILQSLRDALQHDQGGLDYSEAVGIPISNASELRSEVEFYERAISFIEDRIRALGGRT